MERADKCITKLSFGEFFRPIQIVANEFGAIVLNVFMMNLKRSPIESIGSANYSFLKYIENIKINNA